jgi:hypothetical protein
LRPEGFKAALSFTVDPKSNEFKANVAAMRALVEELHRRRAR